MSTGEKLNKALNEFIRDFNEKLDKQENIAINIDAILSSGFRAGAKAAATLIKNAETNSMRDAMAAHALGGLLANSGGPVQANLMSATGYANTNAADVAAWAYELADAMLRERKR